MNPKEKYGFVSFDDMKQDTEKFDKYGFVPFNPSSSQPSQEIPEENQPEDESALKSTIRYGSQIPQGILGTTAPGLLAGLWQALAHGEIYDPEEIEHIKMISEREGIPFDEEKYYVAAEKALGGVPTVSNIASKIEEKTGIPLEPKTRGQKALRFATEATRLAPENSTLRPLNTVIPKSVVGAGVEGVKELLEELGIPEPISEIASFGIIKKLPEGSPNIGVGQKTKPSGLTERRFENIKEKTEVSPKTLQKINTNVENEFRNIASDIIENSPIEETFSAVKENKSFKKETSEAFKKVESLAEQIDEKLPTTDLKKKIADISSKQKVAGFLPSEYEQAHKKFINKFIKDTPNKLVTPVDFVKQYRKNNKALGELYESGQSKAYNRAKKDALLDYNQAIAETFKDKFPDTEFSNLFESTNKTWANIMDVEAIEGFMDDLFDGSIKYDKGKKFLDRNGMKDPFKRALGDEGVKHFEQLVEDLMSSKEAYKMLKVAESKGYGDFAKTTLAYVMHPKLGFAKAGYDAAQYAYRKSWEALLDKPQLAIKWDKGVKDFKKGKFADAKKTFDLLKNEVINME